MCLGQGAFALATGALILFASNLLALVLAGSLVFTVLGYSAEAEETRGRPRRRAYLTIGILLVVVGIPLVGNTVATYVVTVWTNRVQETADGWVSGVPGASIQDVTFTSTDFVIEIQTPGELPPVEQLVSDLEGKVPDGFSVVVNTSLGEEIDAGTIGG